MTRFLREQGPVPARTREQAMRTIRLRKLCVCPTCRAADPLRQAVWETDTTSLRKGLNVRSPGRRRVESEP